MPIPGDALSSAAIETANADFHRAHQQSYGFSAPQEPTEIVSLNLRAVGHIGKPKPVVPRTPNRSSAGRERQVWFSQCNGFVACPIVSRHDLPVERRLIGPVIVEELDSTVVVLPGYQVRRTDSGSLVIDLAGKEAQ